METFINYKNSQDSCSKNIADSIETWPSIDEMKLSF